MTYPWERERDEAERELGRKELGEVVKAAWVAWEARLARVLEVLDA